MNHKFASHVTSVAFHLSLSKSMVALLVGISNKRQSSNVLRLRGLRDTVVGTGRCLEDRGLIYAPDPKWPGIYELTKAGELTVDLLKEAGFVESEVACAS